MGGGRDALSTSADTVLDCKERLFEGTLGECCNKTERRNNREADENIETIDLSMDNHLMERSRVDEELCVKGQEERDTGKAYGRWELSKVVDNPSLDESNPDTVTGFFGDSFRWERSDDESEVIMLGNVAASADWAVQRKRLYSEKVRDESIHAGMISSNLKGETKVFPRGYPHISIDDIVGSVLQVQHPTVSQENISVAMRRSAKMRVLPTIVRVISGGEFDAVSSLSQH